MEQAKAEDLAPRITTAVRGADLYSPTHPLVQRGIDNLVASAQEALQRSASVIVGFIDDEIVVDGIRLPRGTAALVGFARDLREREIEKITITRGISREEIRAFVAGLGDRKNRDSLAGQLAGPRGRHITLRPGGGQDVSDQQDRHPVDQHGLRTTV